jgi:hypothetical protein
LRLAALGAARCSTGRVSFSPRLRLDIDFLLFGMLPCRSGLRVSWVGATLRLDMIENSFELQWMRERRLRRT